MDRPLICSDWEVQGLLAGRIKRLWRPVQHCKEFPRSDQWPVWYPAKDGAPVFLDRDAKGADKLALRYAKGKPSPFGVAGDVAWIRETFRPVASGSAPGLVRYGVAYRVDQHTRWNESPTRISFAGAQPPPGRPLQFREPKPWSPPQRMHRRYSRLSVLIEGIRLLRVQSATEEDARLSGLDEYTLRAADESPNADIPRRALAKLWDTRIARRPEHAWERNPWAWCANVKEVQRGE